MGLCAGRDKPGSVLEINDDLVAKQAKTLLEKHEYGVEHGKSQEESLVSLAANMQAMRENIRTKSAFHLNKRQRFRKNEAFRGILGLVQRRMQPNVPAAGSRSTSPAK